MAIRVFIQNDTNHAPNTAKGWAKEYGHDKGGNILKNRQRGEITISIWRPSNLGSCSTLA